MCDKVKPREIYSRLFCGYGDFSKLQNVLLLKRLYDAINMNSGLQQLSSDESRRVLNKSIKNALRDIVAAFGYDVSKFKELKEAVNKVQYTYVKVQLGFTTEFDLNVKTWLVQQAIVSAFQTKLLKYGGYVDTKMCNAYLPLDVSYDISPEHEGDLLSSKDLILDKIDKRLLEDMKEHFLEIVLIKQLYFFQM